MFNKKFALNKKSIGLIVPALFSFYAVWQIYWPQFHGVGDKVYQVNKGENFWDIASGLKQAGLIQDRLIFAGLAWLRGSIFDLKAGQYKFEPESTTIQILRKIENGEAVVGADEVVVGLPEGFDLQDIAQRIEEAGLSSSFVRDKPSDLTERFAWLTMANAKYNTLEGFLFPDTYRFDKDAHPNQILNKILRRFESKTESLRKEAVLAGQDFYKIIIMASILEKEVPPADMPLAAGVLWRRLELGMPLQADATLVYALGRAIVKSDTTSLNSPYNTYQYKGLPPTPIANPGLIALDAALHPQKSSYLYYLSRSRDGGTVFSKTLEEHNLAKARYLNN